MFMFDLIAALIVALVMGGALAYFAGHRFRPSGSRSSTSIPAATLFLLLFMAIWAGGLWVGPVGPPLAGVSWFGFLFVGMVLASLLVVAIGPDRAETPVEQAEAALNATWMFVWFALLMLLVSILAAYL